MSVMEHNYSSRNLPGLRQVQRGHFEAFDWSDTVRLNSDNWATLVEKQQGIRISFVMCTWSGFPRNKCYRCFKPRKNHTGSRVHQIWFVKISQGSNLKTNIN
jgi:hypothetical protein